jgi:thioester reductase-like protein
MRLASRHTKFFLLTQKDFVEKAEKAVREIAAKTDTSSENFEVIEGDIREENLDINEEKFETICKTATDVYHLAAIYDLAVKQEIAYRVNVEGTRNVNEFVKKLEKLRHYNYVSTCYVAGKRTGEILETELEHDAGFRNFYEETKYLAEREVEKLKDDGIRLTIFRPSIVVGDSKTGETQKYDGIYSLIHYLRIAPKLFRLVNVGNRDVRLNLVPVDFVVEAIAALSKDDRAIGKTIALADANPLTTEEIFDTLAQAMTGKKSVIKPPPRLVQNFLMLPFTPLISGLPHSGVPYFFVPQTYDTSVADRLFSAHNVACPNFKSYVNNLLKFVEEHPKL